MIARLVRSEDFERVLRSRSRAHSPHFALHHLPERPGRRAERIARAVSQELSTTGEVVAHVPVDDSPAKAPPAAPDGVWLGAVVPKRHARRAVTRTLLKRQIRSVVVALEESLAAGLWVVRLRAPFDRGNFISAASDALKRAARAELELLVRNAARPGAAR